MKMKKFTNPEVEIFNIAEKDVLTISDGNNTIDTDIHWFENN